MVDASNTTTTASTTTTSTTTMIAKVFLNVGYYLLGAIQLIAGGLGMIFPFGIIGDFTPFYSNDFVATSSSQSTETTTEAAEAHVELMTLHLARMCQVTSFFQGILFLSMTNESYKVKAKILAISSMATIVYSIGEILLDTQRATTKLNIDIYHPELYSRSIQFLIGCLDGGSFGTLIIATICFVIGITTPHYIIGIPNINSQVASSTTNNNKKKL